MSKHGPVQHGRCAPRKVSAAALVTLVFALAAPAGSAAASWTDARPAASWTDARPAASWTDARPAASWTDARPAASWTDARPAASWTDRAGKSRRAPARRVAQSHS